MNNIYIKNQFIKGEISPSKFILPRTTIFNFQKATILIAFYIFLIITQGCKKFVDVPAPKNTLNKANVYENDESAIAALTAVYTGLSNGGFARISQTGSLMSDELKDYFLGSSDPVQLAFYMNAYLPTTSLPWLYSDIFTVNAVLEGVSVSSNITKPVREQLLGEAHFLRAYEYFCMVNLYGGVPLAMSTDPNINRLLPRSTISDVYKLIIEDLLLSDSLLSNDYVGANLKIGTTEKVRPNKWVAKALLARAYLYQGEYVNADKYATKLIESGVFTLAPLANTFLKNSSETIWNLQPVGTVATSGTSNTQLGSFYIIPDGGPTNVNPVTLSDELMDAFELGDARREVWTQSSTDGINFYPYAYKYKVGKGITDVTEYEVVFRLAEQYLIRAEAKAKQNNLEAAISDLNIIRTRARGTATATIPNPLPNLPENLTQAQVYAAIEHERQVELFTEGGHRWFDLIRTPGFTNSEKKRADEVMPLIIANKNGTWEEYKKLLPIPASEILLNPSLSGSQNPGYE